MPAQITMPQLTDTMEVGVLVKWLKKEGDKVKLGDPIVEIETDKAAMEYEASEDGTLAVLVAKEGEKIPVGGLIAILARGTEKIEDVKKQAHRARPLPRPRFIHSCPDIRACRFTHACPFTRAACAEAGDGHAGRAEARNRVLARSGSTEAGREI